MPTPAQVRQLELDEASIEQQRLRYAREGDEAHEAHEEILLHYARRGKLLGRCRGCPYGPADDCRSVNQSEFPAELNIHFPGRGNFETPTVWVFPRLLACLNCGLAEFFIRDADVRRLKTPGFAEEQSFGT